MPKPTTTEEFEAIEAAPVVEEEQLDQFKRGVADALNTHITSLTALGKAGKLLPAFNSTEMVEAGKLAQAAADELGQIKTTALNLQSAHGCITLLMRQMTALSQTTKNLQLQAALAHVEQCVMIPGILALSYFNKPSNDSNYPFIITFYVEHEADPNLKRTLTQMKNTILDRDDNRMKSQAAKTALLARLQTKTSALTGKLDAIPAYAKTLSAELSAVNDGITAATAEVMARETSIKALAYSKKQAQIEIINERIKQATPDLMATISVPTGKQVRVWTGMGSYPPYDDYDWAPEYKTFPDTKKREAANNTISTAKTQLAELTITPKEQAEFEEASKQLSAAQAELEQLKLHHQVGTEIETILVTWQSEAAPYLKSQNAKVDTLSTQELLTEEKQVEGLLATIRDCNARATEHAFSQLASSDMPTGLGATSSHFDTTSTVTASAPPADRDNELPAYTQ